MKVSDQMHLFRRESLGAVDSLSLASSTATQFGYAVVAQSIELLKKKVIFIQRSPDPLKVSAQAFHEFTAELSVMLSRMENAGIPLTKCLASLQTCVANTAPSWGRRVICTMTFVACIGRQFRTLIDRGQ